MQQIEAIRQRLRQAREQAGLSQSQIATLLGVDSPATISHIESGNRGLDMERFIQLASIYGVDQCWLLTGVNPNFDHAAFGAALKQSNISFRESMRILGSLESLAGQIEPTGGDDE